LLIKSFRGKHPKIAASAFVAPGVVVIGDVELGEESSIWYGCVLRGDINRIRIGDRTSIQDLSMIHVHRDGPGVWIGDGVTVGHRVMLHSCHIEDQTVIGMGSVVLDHAVIGKGAYVAAGAVVAPRTQVPPGAMVMGVPAKVIRQVNEKEKEYQLGAAQRYTLVQAEHKKLFEDE
jgi:carbonic anhydrase/acetyltransferase-like protein (isoleucine patch superfamily)